MTDIELSGLRKEFGDVDAVDGVDLTVEDGEFLVIVGPSGCGKSTTLRALAGLESVTDGTITFGDREVQSLPPEDRDVAMVFQSYALFPHMTARQNMSFGAASATDFDDGEIETRIRDAAETLDISDLLDRTPDGLSGGEQQRVAIGRALVRDPDVLLMDEPLSNLDAKLRTEMRTELQQLHAALETTTIYVTHDQTEAMTLGDRVAVMRDGRIQQVDEPQAVYDYPQNRFVAEFIGNPSMNTVPVTVADDGRETVVEQDSFELVLSGDGPRPGPAVLGIRPEDLHPAGEVDHTHTEPIELTVDVTEALGDTQLVHGEVEGREWTVTVDPHRSIAWGETLTLACDPDRIHLFDPESGQVRHHSTSEAHADRHAEQTRRTERPATIDADGRGR